MPIIKLTWKQLITVTEIVENEAEALRKYPCDDPQVLKRTCRLRDSFYRQILVNQKKGVRNDIN